MSKEYEKAIDDMSRYPQPKEFPCIYINPRVCGGDPMIEGVSPSVPTLANQVLVGDTVECVAEWFGVSVDDVRLAVAYWSKYGRLVEGRVQDAL